MSVEPLILAIASGKGGVGKTMLSVACAYELSLGGPTLLLDLDFFNRGLAGLFPEGEVIAEVPRPDFLANPHPSETESWHLIRIAPDLYHVTYPDLGPTELSGLEISSVAQIRESLGRFIAAVREKCGALRVVLDCHGGPDHTSFAAATLARHTLLISEPDRITFHGTLNFLRQLDRSLGDLRASDPDATADVRLIFNKIIPAIRAPFLRRLYDEYLRDEFGGYDLLGLFPLELPLAKAFEETPLITRAYPYSLLAQKMRVLLLDLLEDRAKDYLAPSAVTLPGWVRKHRRRTLGHIPWFLNQEVILQIITFLAFFFLILSFLDKRFIAQQRPAFYSTALIAIASRHPEVKFDSELVFKTFLKGMAKRTFFESGDQNPPLDSFPPAELFYTWHLKDGFLEAALEDAPILFGTDSLTSWNGPPDPNIHLPAPGSSKLDLQLAQHYFLRNVAESIHPVLLPEDWKRDLITLRSARWWNWTLHSIRLWWHDWYWHGLVLGLAWLGTAFYLDCTRKIDAAFVRALLENYYAALVWLALAIAMWTIPALYIINGVSIASGGSYLTAGEAAAWFLVLPYLFVIGHQLYRCYRLQHDGFYDLMHREPTWQGRLRYVFAMARMNTSLGQELYLRMVFVLALFGALILFYLLVIRGHSFRGPI